MSFNQLLFSQKADFSSSLVGWWTFDDGTGTHAFDSGLGANQMTMSTTPPPSWTGGKIGGSALQFTGSAYIQTNSDPQLVLLGGTQSFSEACWFKTTMAPTQSMAGICMSHAGQADGQYEKGIGVTQSGKAGAYTFELGGASARILSGSTLINAGNWHHVAAVFNGEHKTYQLYVDGRMEATQAHKATFTYSGTAYMVCSFAFGSGGTVGTWQPFSGSIDDVRVWNRALTPQDVLSLYRYSQPDLNMGLILYYKFDEGTGTVANDSSPIGRNGTLEHSPVWVGGKIGTHAIKTQTTNDLVTPSPVVPMTGSWTIATWTSFPQPATFNNALTRCGVNSGSGNVHVYVNNKILGCYMASDGTAFHSSGYDTTGLSGWHHIAAVGSGSKTTFFIDGVNVATSSAQANDVIDTIGNNIQSSNQPWGTFDDFRIYNRALAQADIQALYNFRY
jgi:hypothetical protein